MEFEHLAVIDMQRGFLKHKPLREVLRIKEPIMALTQWARAHSIPVTYALYLPEKWGTLLPGINPLSPDELVVKEHDNAFTSPEFEQRMQGYGLLCIAGCHLEYCIRETIQGAITYGHPVIVYQDAILAFSEGSPLAVATLDALQKNPKVFFQPSRFHS